MPARTILAAHEKNIPCFCADLIVPPILLEWNRNLAARLAPLPDLRIGMLESNGAQLYRHWPQLLALHPCPDATWLTPQAGTFLLDDDFYRTSGGMLLDAPRCRTRCEPA